MSDTYTRQIPAGTVLLTEATKNNQDAVPTAGTLRVLPDSDMSLNTLTISDSVTLDTGAYQANPVQAGLTAFAGGGQAKATQLNYGTNEVTTVATAADSVKLPALVPGVGVRVINAGSKAAQVFLGAAGTINGVDGVATGVSLSNGASAVYTAVSATKAYT